MNVFAWLYLATLLVDVGLLILLLAVRRNRNLSGVFALFVIGLIVWNMAQFLTTLGGGNLSTGSYGFYTHLAALGYTTVPVTILIFAVMFSGRERLFKSYSFWIATLFVALGFLALSLSTDLVINHQIAAAPLQEWGYNAPPGPLFPLFLLWFELLFVAGFVLIIKKYLESTGTARKQAFWLAAGLIVPLIGGTITNGILPILHIEILPTALPLTSTFGLLTVYAIIKYQLFDISALELSRDVLSSIPELVAVIDAGGRIEQANRNFADFFNSEVAKLHGTQLGSLIGAEAAERIEAERVARHGRTFELDDVVIDLFGDKIYAKIAGSELTDSAGKYSGLVLIITDVTEIVKTSLALAVKTAEAEESVRKLERTEKAELNIVEDLEESNRRTIQEKANAEALISSIGDGIIATDSKGHIISVNRVALDLLGVKESDLIGKWFPGAVPATDEAGQPVAAEDRIASQALLSAMPVSKRSYYTRTDGSRFPVLITAAPVLLDGKPEGVVEVFRDITRELEVDRMKTEFISLASHQLRTPATGVKAFLSMTLEGDAGKLSNKQAEFVGKAYEGNEREIKLIEDLLNVSRLEAGRLPLNVESTNVTKMIEGIISEQSKSIANRNQIVTKELPPSPLIISADPEKLRMSVGNLLDNASKYTPAGGQITIKAEAGKGQTKISVSDNGIGIEESDIPNLFKRFSTAANAKEMNVGSTGLGLYLVKSMIEMQGGKVSVESKIGKGSTFTITLPNNIEEKNEKSPAN